MVLTALQSRSRTITGAFTWNETTLSLNLGADARSIRAAVASGEAYRTLGIKAQVGRLLDTTDDSPQAPAVVVLSDRFWSSQFDRDRHVIGRTIRLNRHPFIVAGILPAKFHGMFPGNLPEVTIPIRANAELHPKWDMLHRKNVWWLSVFARLRTGITLPAARAELATISPQILNDVRPGDGDDSDFLNQQITLVDSAGGGGITRDRYRLPLYVLLAASTAVLGLCCVNLASLMLIRAADRTRELSVRLALGASRSRVIRYLLLECLLISGLGAGLGAILGLCAIVAARPLLLFSVDLSFNWRIYGYLLVVAVLTGIAFCIAPAWTTSDLGAAGFLRNPRIGADRRAWSVGLGLVSLQVALSVVLLVAAFAFAQTLRKLHAAPAGLQTEHLAFVQVNANESGLNGQQLTRFFHDLLITLRQNRSVHAVSLSAAVPLTGAGIFDELAPSDFPQLSKQQRTIFANRVAPDYFKTVGTTILRGSDFGWDDPVANHALINRSAALLYFQRQNPIGQTLTVLKKRYVVSGIVADSSYISLRQSPPPTIFVPALQVGGDGTNPIFSEKAWNILIRTDTDTGVVQKDIRNFVHASARDIEVGSIFPFDQIINDALLSERLMALLTTIFAALTLILVVVGLHGVLRYAVTRRKGEIGLRMALGGTPAVMVRMVLRQTLIVLTSGLSIGILVVFLGWRFAATLLYDVSPGNLSILVPASALLLIVALTTAAFPARRAAHVDPAEALRSE